MSSFSVNRIGERELYNEYLLSVSALSIQSNINCTLMSKYCVAVDKIELEEGFTIY